MPKAETPLQNAYADRKIAQLLRDLDKYISERGETAPEIKGKEKKELYSQFTELLLNLGNHQDAWEAFKADVDRAIATMQKDTARLNTIVYNDLRKTGLQTREEKLSAPKKSPSYSKYYQEAFSDLSGAGKTEPFSPVDVLEALGKQSNKTGRATTIDAVNKQLKKLASLGLVAAGYKDIVRVPNPFRKTTKKKTASNSK